MSTAWSRRPESPTMWPRNLSGVGTVADAGKWSTSSVEIRGSESRFLIIAVYSASTFCVACANSGAVCDSAPAASTAALHRRIEAVERDILSPCAEKGEFRKNTKQVERWEDAIGAAVERQRPRL